MSSAVSGLDQLCAAACAGGSPKRPPSIKVIEVEAYGSVADLIQAAIVSNDGAADLKAIYEVCELHGRIAYRRADGSRIITCNDHWKSQVRHALYTGGKFQRNASNSDLWELSPSQKGRKPSLVKVLVRADDSTANIRASLNPHCARKGFLQTTRNKRENVSSSPLTVNGGCLEASAEVTAMCDSIEPGDGKILSTKQYTRNYRVHPSVEGPPDDHSTLQEDPVDEATNMPDYENKNLAVTRMTPLAPRRSRRIITRAVAALDAALVDDQKSSPNLHAENSVIESHDPSTLHWGTSRLRSAIVIADSRSPAYALSSEKRRNSSENLESQQGFGEADSGQVGRNRKTDGRKKRRLDRRRTNAPQVEAGSMPQPINPQLLAQWANALHQTALSLQNASRNNGEMASFASTAGSLPSYLPTIMAAAAPLMALGAPQGIQEQMRAAFELSSAALVQASAEVKNEENDESKS